MRKTLIAAFLAAGFATPTLAADDAVLAELKRLAARIEALEKQNKDLEKALNNERLSEKDPEIATRIKHVENQLDAIKGPATKLAEALDGVKGEGGITTVAQRVTGTGTAAGVDQSRTNYRGDINVTMPVGSMGDNEGSFFTHLRFGQGTGVGLRSTYTSTPNTTAFQKHREPTIPSPSSPRPGTS